MAYDGRWIGDCVPLLDRTLWRCKCFGRTLAISLAALLLNSSLFHANAKAQARRGGNLAAAGVYKAQIVPNWFGNNSRFWYRNDLRDGAKEFVLVDAVAGTRKAAFDHRKLAGALSSASGKQISAERLPFESIDFIDEDKSIRFNVGEVWWKCDLRSYQCEKIVDGAQKAAQPAEPPGLSKRRSRRSRQSLTAFRRRQVDGVAEGSQSVHPFAGQREGNSAQQRWQGRI
jgi:hypothetical protein